MRRRRRHLHPPSCTRTGITLWCGSAAAALVPLRAALNTCTCSSVLLSINFKPLNNCRAPTPAENVRRITAMEADNLPFVVMESSSVEG
ncbi:hypothetical protein PR003_g8048 [Phytophthora rubi]|uniref:Secreted protein n=1 Tax=Phytophthora rubi TaxID=129364 RepID=A0A6A3N0M8_9STRA|nr:hypothetical protein PR002_g7806 [Phytophthora rubi]KAE9039400.1 hypothetical protein PR001_g7514 [Phytophthora rubi]KAE9345218.1 hypothetical protein PR003_g8048 [Phytophthora rubi]